MEHITRVMMQLIRGVIFSAPIPENLCEGLDEAALASLYSLSKHHDVAHIVAAGLERCGGCMSSELAAKFAKQKTLAAFRYSIQKNELAAICEVLEEARIEFIPLKGSVLRDYYPEGWMRTSCDIDILVHKEEFEHARDAIVRDLGYECGGVYTHHLILSSPSGVHLELHFTLVNDKIFEKVWKDSISKNGGYEKVLSNAMFYYYHIVHMSRHYVNGGCGIRPFIDLYILNHIEGIDKVGRDSLLVADHLSIFEKNAIDLCEIWFDGKVHNSTTINMEFFVLKGGVYGNMENHFAIQRSKRGGTIKYVLSRIWVPYSRLRNQYPSLNRKILVPLYQVRRWFNLLFSAKTRKRSINELRSLGAITKQEQDFIKSHLAELDL